MEHTRDQRRVRDLYPTLLELALIAALLLITIAFLLSKRMESASSAPETAAVTTLELEPIPITEQHKTPPPPARPSLPVEDPTLDPEADLTFASFDDIPGFDYPIPPLPSEVEEESIPFYAVEQPPQIVGGVTALYSYLRDNDLYPAMARKSGLSGMVLVAFTVGVDGRPYDVRVKQERPEGLGFGAAGVQAIEAMRFTPGIQREKPVAVSMEQLIRFKLK